MDKILVLFLIGIAFGVLVPFAEKANQTAKFLDEPLTVIEHIFVAGAGIWHIAISVLILISLPASLFKSIRNRLSKKTIFTYSIYVWAFFWIYFYGRFRINCKFSLTAYFQNC